MITHKKLITERSGAAKMQPWIEDAVIIYMFDCSIYGLNAEIMVTIQSPDFSCGNSCSCRLEELGGVKNIPKLGTAASSRKRICCLRQMNYLRREGKNAGMKDGVWGTAQSGVRGLGCPHPSGAGVSCYS